MNPAPYVRGFYYKSSGEESEETPESSEVPPAESKPIESIDDRCKESPLTNYSDLSST